MEGRLHDGWVTAFKDMTIGGDVSDRARASSGRSMEHGEGTERGFGGSLFVGFVLIASTFRVTEKEKDM